ncbi:MAG: putative Ig domain-containing protein [Chthoniobacterales bacterium]
MSDAFPILTPPPSRTPRINGARIVGVRSGSPFLFHVPAAGARPMQHVADGLPAGLHLDETTGDIAGVLPNEGRHEVKLRAANEFGAVERGLTIVVGERIALTPPMGWNSWNCFGGQVSEEKVRAAARAMVALGLREHGWSYVNIDDGWQGARGGPFNAIQPNAKFADMRGLANEVHSLGLKFGIYSTPWRASFYAHIGSSADDADGAYDWVRAGGHTDVMRYRYPHERSRLEQYHLLASWGRRLTRRRIRRINRELRRFGKFSFVAQDVRQWAEWGVDFLKYDWVPIDLPHVDEVQQALRACERDIVLSLSNNAALSLAPAWAERAELWRTSSDVMDDWRHIERAGFSRDAWAPFQGPGHYNDPDMLVLGEVGWDYPRPTRLTADEQYAHMSLWCLLGAPLLLGCDLEKLDPFTLGLITNDEVLEVNQDPLCRQATSFAGGSVFAKPLQDGSLAVGLFNRGEAEREFAITWSELGLLGAQRLRDLWRQQNLGVFPDHFSATIPPHGVVLLLVTREKKTN